MNESLLNAIRDVVRKLSGGNTAESAQQLVNEGYHPDIINAVADGLSRPDSTIESKRGVTYMVDIPDPNDLTGSWIELGSFDDRHAALEFVKEKFGSEDGTIDLISEVETDEDDSEDDA